MVFSPIFLLIWLLVCECIFQGLAASHPPILTFLQYGHHDLLNIITLLLAMASCTTVRASSADNGAIVVDVVLVL